MSWVCGLESIKGRSEKGFQKSGNGWTGVSHCLALLCFILRGLETVLFCFLFFFKGSFFTSLFPLAFSPPLLLVRYQFSYTYFPFHIYSPSPLPRFLVRFLYIDFLAGVSSFLPLLPLHLPAYRDAPGFIIPALVCLNLLRGGGGWVFTSWSAGSQYFIIPSQMASTLLRISTLPL